MKAHLFLVALSALMLACTQCASTEAGSDLTRPLAKKVITGKGLASQPKWDDLSGEEVKCLIREGVWTVDIYHMDIYGDRPELRLTPKGNELFTEAGFYGDDRRQQLLWDARRNHLQPQSEYYILGLPKEAHATLRKRVGLSVAEITGITDAPAFLGPHTKFVDYTVKWERSEFPDVVQRCIPARPAPRPKQAVLKLYDDGWRLERFQ